MKKYFEVNNSMSVCLFCFLFVFTFVGCSEKPVSLDAGGNQYHDSYDNLHYNYGVISHNREKNCELMVVTLNGVKVLFDQDDTEFPRSTVVMYRSNLNKIRYKRLDIQTEKNNLLFVDEDKEAWLFAVKQGVLNKYFIVFDEGKPEEIIKAINEIRAMK